MKHLVGSAVLAAWAVSSVATAQVPEAIPSAVYTAPARLVEIGGGRKLNLFCQGHGPVVLMETGFSDTTMTWRKVQARIAAFATACSYDRAGLGFSDPSDHPSDLVHNAADLEWLIKAAGLGKPVLVGHSLGGRYVSYYARTHPGQVAGLVLVDPSTFGQRESYLKFLGPDAVAKLDANRLEQVARYRRCLDLARAGQLVPGRPGDAACLDDPPLEDPVLHAETDRQLARAQTQAATLSEYLAFHGETPSGPTSDQAQWSVAPSLADAPPVILLRRVYGKPASVSQAAYDGIVTDAVAEFAELAPAPSGQVLTVANTGHQIQLDQPQAVIDAVREVVERSRK
ncbi:alpha/beta fold hydrolase [Caulobacter sp. LjRoot300]|uniref:alpha/beta fold hydrolase n=1 Tax=Caulobacter sp. LjRoot300 TaxID=3342321 RepID=UPI003ECF1647